MSGRVIVLEGVGDGVGKTTQLRMLYDHLMDDGYQVIHHHFPSYGTPQAAPVEQYLAGAYGKPSEVKPLFANSLYAVDRVATWLTSLREQYLAGKIILLDRYTTSSLIYQSAYIESGLPKRDFIAYVEDFEYRQQGLPWPDEVIFLSVPLELLDKLRAERQAKNSQKPDIHEQDENFIRRVHHSALEVASILKWSTVQCATKDGVAMRSPDDIHKEVYSLVMEVLQNQSSVSY